MRLIDADALKPLLREYCVDNDEVVMKWYDIMGVDEVVDRAPTIDAVPATIDGALGYLHKVGWIQEHDRIMTEDAAPVRHGHWIEDQDRIVCSECGARFRDEIIYMQENKPGAPHRCLECGAIMDKEENDGTDDGDC